MENRQSKKNVLKLSVLAYIPIGILMLLMSVLGAVFQSKTWNYDEVRRSTGMCEALRELMKDEIEEELKKNREKSLEEGETQAKKEMAYELYHEEGFTIERIAKLVKMDQKIVEEWLLQK